MCKGNMNLKEREEGEKVWETAAAAAAVYTSSLHTHTHSLSLFLTFSRVFGDFAIAKNNSAVSSYRMSSTSILRE